MNNPLNKIDISKSSLLGLKAELLRKRNEFDKLKSSTPVKAPAKKTKLPKIKEVSIKPTIDPEEAELLRRSKEILEQKARIYENLTTPGASTEETNDIYLVQFAEKQNETLDEIQTTKDESETSGSDSEGDSSAEEIEYVDYFGRTHVYPRSDLKMYIEKDKRLSKMLQLFPSDKLIDDIEKLNKKNNATTESFSKKDAEMLSSDMKRELMRQEWERQEEQLKSKNVIHYQDILFNEARLHGVAYYQFSSDDTERAMQHKALDDLRQETLQEQKRRAEHRARKEQERKQRVLAAKNRVRARKGLPPLELPEEPEEEQQKVLTEKERLAAEKAEREARYEKKKEEMRSLHVRPWDQDKEGIPIFNEMTQEQWVEKKRGERDDDFAPPSFYKYEKKHKVSREYNPAEPSSPQSSDDGNDITINTDRLIEGKLKELRTKVEYSVMDDNEVEQPKGGLRFSSNNKSKQLKRKNINSFTATPIVNEVSDNSSEDENSSISVKDTLLPKRGAEIPPPLTFDYFGPNSTKSKNMKVRSNIEESISAGLEFLKDKVKKKRKVNIEHLDI